MSHSLPDGWVQLTEWEPCAKGRICWVAPPWEDPDHALEELKALMASRWSPDGKYIARPHRRNPS